MHLHANTLDTDIAACSREHQGLQYVIFPRQQEYKLYDGARF